jgi:hypothetical protein
MGSAARTRLAGSEQSSRILKPFWNDLYNAGTDVVLNGHRHNYERFAPQTPDGVADSAKGIREFVVGTGGEKLTAFKSIRANSKVRNGSTFGAFQLTLMLAATTGRLCRWRVRTSPTLIPSAATRNADQEFRGHSSGRGVL